MTIYICVGEVVDMLGGKKKDIQELREFVNEIKDTAMIQVPWVFPYALGAAAGIVGMILSVKSGRMVIHSANHIFIPDVLLEGMEKTGNILLCPDVTKTADMAIHLIKKG